MVGTFVSDITESTKPKSLDEDVIGEEDVWIGCNVTLLSGVTIGRESTIAVGAVVAKILEHEAKLYEESQRYTREQIEEIFRIYNK